MSALDAVWHVLNFMAPAAGVAALASAFAKLLWRRELKGVAWARLALWAAGACLAVLVAGLIVFGHDGRIATYAAMVAACGLTLYWIGFGRGAR